jgi:gamma-glutamylcyclotransferase (GGCT)/AIG2-like uncharacterized protein YtfP
MKLIACYGSLRKGMGNSGLIRNANFVSEEVVEIPYDMIDMGSYPGLIHSENRNKIKIETYLVDSPTYIRVEHLEGYPHFYDRIGIDTSHGMADIYFLPRGGYRSTPLVKKNERNEYDWTEYLRTKHSRDYAN